MGLRNDEFRELNSEIEIDKEPDLKTRKEKAKIDRLEHENSVNKENQEARKVYLKKTFNFVRIYILVVIVIFIIYQFGLVPLIKRPMPTMPIVTLLSTTTANIIGLLVIGFNYLFSNHKK